MSLQDPRTHLVMHRLRPFSHACLLHLEDKCLLFGDVWGASDWGGREGGGGDR